MRALATAEKNPGITFDHSLPVDRTARAGLLKADGRSGGEPHTLDLNDASLPLNCYRSRMGA